MFALINHIGKVERKSNDEFTFKVGTARQLIRKPHSKDLTGAEVIDIRQFLMHAGWSAHGPSEAPKRPDHAAPSLLVVIDHHAAKIFQIDVSGNEVSEQTIRPYDPHGFGDHLIHKDQDRERDQRVPEEASFYRQTAEAVAAGGRIVVVSHGTGKNDAAHHWVEYLRKHHTDTYARIVHELGVDLSAITEPQLLDLARDALA